MYDYDFAMDMEEQNAILRKRNKQKLNELLDKYGGSREAINQHADLKDSMEYLFSHGDKLIDEVLEERRLAQGSQEVQNPLKIRDDDISQRDKDKFLKDMDALNLTEQQRENLKKLSLSAQISLIRDLREERDNLAINEQNQVKIDKTSSNKVEVDYSKYGTGFSREFIDEMLKDKRFAHAMVRTHLNEGGYVNHPNDRGGETNHGISSKIYPYEDIKNMTLERATAIYYRDYWIKPKVNKLPDDYVDVVFDDGVVQGQSTAIMNLQKALGICADGIIGSETLDAARNTDYKSIRKNFIRNVNQIEDEYQRKHPEQKVFEKGHRNRYNNY